MPSVGGCQKKDGRPLTQMTQNRLGLTNFYFFPSLLQYEKTKLNTFMEDLQAPKIHLQVLTGSWAGV